MIASFNRFSTKTHNKSIVYRNQRYRILYNSTFSSGTIIFFIIIPIDMYKRKKTTNQKNEGQNLFQNEARRFEIANCKIIFNSLFDINIVEIQQLLQ